MNLLITQVVQSFSSLGSITKDLRNGLSASVWMVMTDAAAVSGSESLSTMSLGDMVILKMGFEVTSLTWLLSSDLSESINTLEELYFA